MRSFFASAAVLLSLLLLPGEEPLQAAKPFARPVFTGETPVQVRESVKIGDRRVDRTDGTLLAWYDPGEKVAAGPVEVSAREWLKEHAAAFGGEEVTGGLRTVAVKYSPGGTHVHFRQFSGDIPLYDACFNVSVGPESTVRMLVANPLDDFSLPSRYPLLPGEEAVRLTRTLLAGSGPELMEPEVYAAGYRDRDGEDHLAWVVRLPTMDPMGDWEVLWDALDGEHLATFDWMKYHTGTGMVFDPDPLTTAERNYGGQYVDNDDRDVEVLNAERREVTLNNITYRNGYYYLEGPYVEISDFEAPEVAPVRETDPHDFVYTRSRSGFEDVMVYYHIDKAQRHLQALGFDEIQVNPISADPHGLAGADNSHYIPATNSVAFGEGGVDDAEDADIIYHEYGHAMVADQVPNLGGGHTSSIEEGFCDYWAGTFSARISDYHDNWFANWDGHNNFWNGRVLDYFGVYPDHWTDDIYNNGQIWSSCLWLIRGDIGADEADMIIVQSHYYYGWGTMVSDASEALLLADQALFDGEHAAMIATRCYQKGFLEEGPETSAISGIVYHSADETTIEGAVVSVDGEQQAITEEDGSFLAGGLVPGEHLLEIRAEGYGPWEEEVELGLNDTLEVAINLAQPDPEVDTETLDITVQIHNTLDTSVVLSNSGPGELVWSVRFRWEGVEVPHPWTQEELIDLGDGFAGTVFRGVAVADGYIVLYTPATDPGRLYCLNAGGDLLRQVNLPEGIEFSCIAGDGEIVYGKDGSSIYGISLEGVVVDTVPTTRRIASGMDYDPVRRRFWMAFPPADNAPEIEARDREGNLVAELESARRITAIAWNEYDPDCRPLYIGNSIGNWYGLSKLDVEEGTPNRIITLEEEPVENPRLLEGLTISAGVDGWTDFRVCPVLVRRLDDTGFQLRLYLLDTAVDGFSASPAYGRLEMDQQQQIEVTVDANRIETGEYGLYLDIVNNSREGDLVIPVDLTVHSVGVFQPGAVPDDFCISPAYPNPFNSVTGWMVKVPERTSIEVRIFNLLGREVDRIEPIELAPGAGRITWTAPSELASGVYLVRVCGIRGEMRALEKVLLLK